MKRENTVKIHAGHAFSQFRFTNYLLNNLSQFDVTPTAKLVLLELSAFYNPKKADVYPKQKKLAEKIGVSERSIVRAIQELVKAGLILIESKYTNHYVFTSKIGFLPSQNEYFFDPDNMSDDLGQNNTSKGDNLTPHKHEPMKEQITEPESVEDFKILKEYAEQRGARNVSQYVSALKRNGAAAKILKDYKDKQAANRYYERQAKETLQKIEQNKIWVGENPNHCQHLQEILRKNWGIK